MMVTIWEKWSLAEVSEQDPKLKENDVRKQH